MMKTLLITIRNKIIIIIIIIFYNLTKGGLDPKGGLDFGARTKSEYSSSRVSNRWPFAVTNSMINIAIINFQIIFKNNTNFSTLEEVLSPIYCNN